MFKVNNNGTETMSLTSLIGVFIGIFEQISCTVLVFPLLTLCKYIPAG